MLTAAFLATWFALAVWSAASGWLNRFDSAPVMAAGVVAPCGGYFVAFAVSARFRRFVRGLDLRPVTWLEAGRIVGGAGFAVAAWKVWMTPAFTIVTFATDGAVGFSSFYAAFVLLRKQPRWFAAWHLAGLVGLFLSVSLAIIASPGVHWIGGDTNSQMMTKLPYSLVPTFLGPMVQIFHLIAMTRYWYSRRAPDWPLIR